MTRPSAWSGLFVGGVTSVLAICVFEIGKAWGYGTGTLQQVRETPPHPAGATGIHSLTTTV